MDGNLKKLAAMPPLDALNFFRNLYHAEGKNTENGIIANALNYVLPVTYIPPVIVGQVVYVMRVPIHFKAYYSPQKIERVRVEHTPEGVRCVFGNRSFEAEPKDIGKTVFFNAANACEAVLRKNTERSFNE